MNRKTWKRVLFSLGFACCGSEAFALDIFVDQNATYTYINATDATNMGTPPSNWFAPGFNDSTWFTGHGPFSSGPVGGTIATSAM
jgi:hypothetical protein